MPGWWGPGPEPSGKDMADYLKAKDARHKRKKGQNPDGSPLSNTDRFAGKYYAGTFDKDLNELAVDTETLWQGYYPSLYNPHTQEAADHLGSVAPGEPLPEPEPPPPTAPAPKIKYGKGKAKRRGDEWYPGIYGMPIPGQSGGVGGASAGATGATGAFRPTVNPDGTLIPWEYSNWMISMGQWRGT